MRLGKWLLAPDSYRDSDWPLANKSSYKNRANASATLSDQKTNNFKLSTKN